MVEFKAVFGPYKEEQEGHRIKWFFSCLLMNDEVRGYTLRFYYASRAFSVKVHSGSGENKYARALADQGKLSLLPETQRGTIKGKRVTDILKSKLGDQRLARATAAALTYGRK